jgi:hypothetical protein
MGVKISELPTFSSPLTGNELVAVVQDSITSQTLLSSFAAPLTGVGGMLARTELSSLSGGWDSTRIYVSANCTSWDNAAAWCTANGCYVINCVEQGTNQGQVKVTTVGGAASTVNARNLQSTSSPTFCGLTVSGTIIASNLNAGYETTVAGGCSYSSIVGGFYGCANGTASFVGGGNYNVTCGDCSAVVNGCYNAVCGDSSSVLAGAKNTIAPSVSASSILAGCCINATASDTAYTQKLIITDVPTSCAGLPVGSIYRSGSDLKIVT